MSIKRGNNNIAGSYNIQALAFASEEEAIAGLYDRKMMSPKTTKAAIDSNISSYVQENEIVDETKLQTELADYVTSEDLNTDLEGYVPTSRTINGQPLTSDIEINTSSGYTKFALNKGNPELLSASTADTLYFNVDSNNPLTYTDIKGNTTTLTSMPAIPVNNVPDGTYKITFGSLNGDTQFVFNNADEEVYIQETDPMKNINLTINGTPTIDNNGNASNFLNSSYLIEPEITSNATDLWGRQYSFTTGDLSANWQYIVSSYYLTGSSENSLNIYLLGGYLTIELTMVGSSSIISGMQALPNTKYVVQIGYNGSECVIIINNSVIDTIPSPPIIRKTRNVLGDNILNQGHYPFLGTIHLAECTTNIMPNDDVFGTNYYFSNTKRYVCYGVPVNAEWVNPQEPNEAYISNTLGNWSEFPDNSITLLDSYITVENGLITDLKQPKYNCNKIDFRKQQLDTVDKSYVIETYVNGTSWYRVYSDGWCEQGGVISVSSSSVTINFLKSFVNTNYTALCQRIENIVTQRYGAYIISRSVNQMSVMPNYSEGTLYISWQTSGYIN